MKEKGKPDRIVYLAITVIAGLLFIPFLGGVNLFDWDEINFAESAREMIVSGDYLTVQINYLPFWEKPPLFIWMQVLSMRLFGINEFAARFPNAICGIITLLTLYSIGKRIYDRPFGLIWVLTYTGSLLPFLYFKSGIIDPWFNLFIFLGIYRIYLFFTMDSAKRLNISLSALFIGLAILTKGPVALLVFMLTLLIYAILKKFRIRINLTDVLLFLIILMVTGGFWFLLQIIQGNFSIIADFIEYQIHLFKSRGAGHGGFLLYHFVVLFFGVFPASVLALHGLFLQVKGDIQQAAFSIVMKILFWVVILLFTLVKTKIVHYSSLCYFPITFLASVILYKVYTGELTLKKYIIWITAFVGIVYGIITITLPFFDKLKYILLSKVTIKDPFALACINADAGWKGFEGFPAIVLLTGLTIMLLKSCKSAIFTGLQYMFISSILFVYLSMLFITPGIEKYSQHAAIEFFKSVCHEEAYVETLGYKSYAHLFYGEKRPGLNPESASRNWLLTGDIDKKVYFSIKTDKEVNYLKRFPELKVLYRKNGYVFCIREMP